MSIVDPAGPGARVVATLWWVMLVGATLIFCVVMALVAAAFYRAQPRSDETRMRGAPAGSDETRVERRFIVGLGLVFPMVTLFALLVYGMVVGERLLPRAGPEVLKVGAEGRRYAWRFSYEALPERVTEGVLHIPAGRPVDVAITTADVIHSFWVPRLAGKLDAIPGHVNVLRLEADEPGTYAALSAEFSGPGYAGFTFSVVAHDAAGWDAFMSGETE